MILNFYDKIGILIDDILVADFHLEKFRVASLDRHQIEFSLEIKATKRINDSNCVNVSTYMKYDDENIYLCDKNGKLCHSLFGKSDSNCVEIACEVGFDFSELLAYVIKPFLRYKLMACGMAFVHGSSFRFRGKNYIIAAWAHTGKTSVLISALENGGQFLGDDFSVISKHGEIYPYTVPINLFDYNFENHETLRKRQSFSRRAKLATAKVLARILSFFQSISASSKMKYLFYAAKTFFQASIHIAVFPEQINAECRILEKSKIDKVVLLESAAQFGLHGNVSVSAEVLAERLQHCINYEFQRFNELYTSAKWVPYYKGEKSFENKEADIYLSCFRNCDNTCNQILPKTKTFDDYFCELVQ